MVTMNKTCYIFISDSLDPYYNLSLEEHLLNSIKANEIILLFYRNEDSIIIGKNQNPWVECNKSIFDNNDINIVRRLSGGGTVFHDIGNLNYSFISDKNIYKKELFRKIIINSLQNFDISIHEDNRDNLFFNNKKFSGTAYCFKRNTCMHHGTFLINSNLDKLSRYLKRKSSNINTNSTKSVQAKVINLQTVKHNLNHEKIQNSIIKTFSNHYNIKSLKRYRLQSKDNISLLYNKYSSWHWNYGHTPKFSINFFEDFTWGNFKIEFSIRNGYIFTINLFSNIPLKEISQLFNTILHGSIFSKQNLLNKITELLHNYKNNLYINDICSMLLIKFSNI